MLLDFGVLVVLLQIKASTDYHDERFPSAANILDFIRCSVTYPTMKDLLNGLNAFRLKIINKEISCILSIVRIKNGFSSIENDWKSMKDAEYRDIKLNCIYYDDTSQQCMIVEIQFLLSFLLKAKKLGHKLYNIYRRKPFIINVTNECYNIDCNYENYSNKIYKLIENNDANNFSKQLFLQFNKIVSLIRFNDLHAFYPILVALGRNNNMKLVESFLSHLYHFHYQIVTNNNNNNINNTSKQDNDDSKDNDDENIFLKDYLNFERHDLLTYEFVKYIPFEHLQLVFFSLWNRCTIHLDAPFAVVFLFVRAVLYLCMCVCYVFSPNKYINIQCFLY